MCDAMLCDEPRHHNEDMDTMRVIGPVLHELLKSSQLRDFASQAAPDLNNEFLCGEEEALNWMQRRGLEFLHFSVTPANLD